MANNRITENYRYSATLDRISNVKNIADNTNESAVSGRKLRHISDDPVSTIKVLRNRGRIVNIDQFRKSIEFGRGYLAKTEDALGSIYESLSRAKELSIQQANSAYDTPARQAVAAEIRQIMEHVAILGNTRYGDKYIFGGFQSSTPPIAPDGNYLGDDGNIYIQVDEDSFRSINITGRDIFDIPPEQEGQRPPLIGILHNLYDALDNNNPQKLHETMSHLDLVMDKVMTLTASLGARQVALNDVAERMDRGESQLHEDTNHLEATDMVKSALDLKRAESALQFTLQASSKMLTPSLLDFLR